jgi:hypothetical protein
MIKVNSEVTVGSGLLGLIAIALIAFIKVYGVSMHNLQTFFRKIL